MFDRSAGYTKEQKPVPVQLQLAGAQPLKGRLLLPHGVSLTDFLNTDAQFFEFHLYSGERLFIGKASVVSVEPVGLPRSDQLTSRLGQICDFDPFEILGLPPDADSLAIRTAYRDLAKSYHPDRYAALELPSEIKDYVNAMFQRINSAYALLAGEANGASTTP